MSKRGRKSGYKNFSVAEQILLCSVVEGFLPLGRDNWEQAAIRYNARRPRGTCERDYEALRRKFRNLYGKPKPSGINGEIPEAKKPILMAHEIQRAIELKAGSSIYHDGGDKEDNEEEITKEVSRLAQGSAEGAETDGRGASLPISALRGEGLVAFADAEVDGDESFEESQATQMSDGGYKNDDVVVVSAHKSLLPSPEKAPNEQLDIEHGEEAAGEASAPGTELVVRPAESVTGLQVSDSFLAGNREATSDDGHELPVQAPVSLTDCLPGRHGRAMGRPRRGSHKAIPTQARPDGPTLRRNPENEAADTAEMARFRGLSAVSNRLGGRDLRVLHVRDNFEEMGGPPRTPVEKTAVSESPRTPTLAANKRICAKKRLEALESSVSNLPDSKDSTNQEMVQMMTFFQSQADQRAALEMQQRLAEREQRREDERRDLEERERAHREEASEKEEKYRREREEDSIRREIEMERLRMERIERQDQKKQIQQQFEARLELDRTEARQRHEQMMVVLSALLKKN